MWTYRSFLMVLKRLRRKRVNSILQFVIPLIDRIHLRLHRHKFHRSELATGLRQYPAGSVSSNCLQVIDHHFLFALTKMFLEISLICTFTQVWT